MNSGTELEVGFFLLLQLVAVNGTKARLNR